MRFDNTGIRRQDRLLDEAAARTLLRDGEWGVLSMCDDGRAYGIPVNYVWDGDARLYIHCAPEGRKLRCMDRIPRVSFCVVGRTRPLPAQFTTEYESVVAECVAVRGLPPEERRYALELLLSKYCPDDTETGMQYAGRSFHRTEIVRLDIACCSAKSKRLRSRP